MKLAAQDDPNRASKAVRQLDLGTGQPEERQAVALLGEKVDCIVAENVRGAASLQHPDEMQRELLLDRVQMGEKNPAIDLMDVHGQILAFLYSKMTGSWHGSSIPSILKLY
jgi:hypothetical protein